MLELDGFYKINVETDSQPGLIRYLFFHFFWVNSDPGLFRSRSGKAQIHTDPGLFRSRSERHRILIHSEGEGGVAL